MKKWHKGIILLVLLAVIATLYFAWPKKVSPEVAGVSTTQDPNHPVEIYYGGAQFNNLQAMIGDLAVTIYQEDKVSAFPLPEMGLGSRLVVSRATPVEVTDSKVTKIYRTWKQTVGELLAENNLQLLGQDSVEPPVNTQITYGEKVKITRVAELDLTQNEVINYSVTKKNSADLEKGQTQVERAGSNQNMIE